MAFSTNMSRVCAITPKPSAVNRVAYASIQAGVGFTNCYGCKVNIERYNNIST